MFIQPPSMAYVWEWLNDLYYRQDSEHAKRQWSDGRLNYCDKCPGGTCATFLPITPEWGLKVYSPRELGDRGAYNNHKWSKYVASFGLAPPVSDELVEFEFNGRKWVGFWQASVTVLVETEFLRRDEDYDILLNKLNELGFAGDFHTDNVGYYGDDLVAIDFSHGHHPAET